LQLKTRNNVQRTLNVLGCICRHQDVPLDVFQSREEAVPKNEILGAEHLSWSNLSESCYGMFLVFLQKEDIETKCAALRALGKAIEANPRLLLEIESSGTIEAIMSENAHPEIHIAAICCWRDILLVSCFPFFICVPHYSHSSALHVDMKSEERRIESGIAKAQMDAKSDITVTHRISGDQDSEATIVGGVLTKYAPRLHDLTKSSHQRLRFASLELLGNLLRQGLVNPLQTVPYLLALQGDVDAPAIRSLALKLLIVEGEKRPEMLRQRMCAGVKQAYLFQRSVYPGRAQASALAPVKKGKTTEIECIFGDIFTICVASSKVQRQGLYKNLLRLFESRDNESRDEGPKATGETEARAPVDVSLLCFVAEILAHLPYNTAMDPLFIIYHVSSVAALQGGQLSDRLAAFLRPFGLSGNDEFDESNAGEDSLERAAQSKTPCRHKEATPISGKGFKLKEFAELCAEAAAIALLLRLKSFLRKVYSLSETRCLEYTPDAKERPFDKNISKPEKMPRFDASIPLAVATDKDGKIYKDALIRQYAEFRRSMRNEANLGMRSPSPEDNKAASSGKKKRARDS
jgi:cohesin loading factor subunit SCC2